MVRLPELIRIKGELMLSQDKSNTAVAEENFQRSLDLARRQETLSRELRTAMSLARLRRGQGRNREAHDFLASVYGRFIEGFGTTDLQRAKRLLEELGEELAVN